MRPVSVRYPCVSHHVVRVTGRRQVAASQSGPQPPTESVSWDPEGLLSAQPSGGHFARRDRERTAAQEAPTPLRQPPGGPPIRPLIPGCADGVAASETGAYNSKAFKRSLAENYMAVDLSYPGLRVLHLDPPVLAVDDFFSAEECQSMVDAAVATGRMESSKVAQYQRGQYFMEHLDGFPLDVALQNGFQRQATLLVYLNDVASGGATKFDHLGLAVRPRRGRALLFFPSFSDGRPDDRTLHTAETADDLKSVTQQWIACGLGKASSEGVEQLLMSGRRSKAAKGKAGSGTSGKGFGAR